MPSGFDYSKWDNIEISDDEADCHPNIDKASWFRMKHRSRVEREEKEETEKSSITKENQNDRDRIEELTQRLREEEDETDREAIEEEMKELQVEITQRNERLEEFERNKKWNVDNMCHVVEERTIVGKNKDNLTSSELPPALAKIQAAKEASRVVSKGTAAEAETIGPQTERIHVESYAEFVERHETLLETFIHTQALEDSQNMLHKHGDILLQEHASSYLLLSCLEEEMNGKHEQMRHVARQSQILSHVCELALSLKRPARDVVVPFFRRIAESKHMEGFTEAVEGFITRIQKRAIDKRKEMQEEANENAVEEVELTREERLGPGGLDPVEVFETLPKSMQDAFDEKDMEKLHKALSEMPMEEVQYHMKRCEDSGLWVK